MLEVVEIHPEGTVEHIIVEQGTTRTDGHQYPLVAHTRSYPYSTKPIIKECGEKTCLTLCEQGPISRAGKPIGRSQKRVSMSLLTLIVAACARV